MILRPDDVEIRLDRGVALNALGRYREALGELDRVLAQQPDNGAALAQRGIALAEVGRYPEAEVALARAISLRPDDDAALDSRGVALQGLDRPAEALALPRPRARDQTRQSPPPSTTGVTRCWRSGATPKRWRAMTARSHSRRPVRACSSIAASRSVRCGSTRRHSTCFNAALLLAPNDARAHCHRGDALMATRQLSPPHSKATRGRSCFGCRSPPPRPPRPVRGQAVRLDADRRDRASARNPYPRRHRGHLAAHAAPLRRHAGAAARLRAPLCSRRVPAVAAPVVVAPARNHDKLRVAYLSANFNRGAMASLIAGLFERHDRAKFEITGISFGADDGRRRTHPHGAGVRCVSRHARLERPRTSPSACATSRSTSRSTSSGHGRGDARPGILASRPAPIQVNYLGHPGTMGADFIDYIIADSIVVPPGEERVLRREGGAPAGLLSGQRRQARDRRGDAEPQAGGIAGKGLRVRELQRRQHLRAGVRRLDGGC